MSSKNKRQKAREKHHLQKRRARYYRIINKYRWPRYNSRSYTGVFLNMVEELQQLNIKYLQVLLSDLNTTGYIAPWSGDYHKMLINSLELKIMESTLLK